MAERKWDHTALKDLACETEFVNRHKHGYRPPDDSAAQVIGKAIHTGVQAWYGGDDDSAPAARAAYGDFDPGSDFRTAELAEKVVRMYTEVYPRADQPFTVLHNEGYVEGDDIVGIPDRVVRRTVDAQVYPLELKTTSLWMGAAWQAQWGHSAQAAIQMDLCEQVYDLTPAGFWLDGIYLSSRRAGPQPEDFVRCGPFQYSVPLRDEFRVRRVRRAMRALELLNGTGAPPLSNEAQCFRYNKLCPFFRFCTADPADRPDMYELALATGELEINHWNPAQRDANDQRAKTPRPAGDGLP